MILNTDSESTLEKTRGPSGFQKCKSVSDQVGLLQKNMQEKSQLTKSYTSFMGGRLHLSLGHFFIRFLLVTSKFTLLLRWGTGGYSTSWVQEYKGYTLTKVGKKKAQFLIDIMGSLHQLWSACLWIYLLSKTKTCIIIKCLFPSVI